jgi:hypothetical protein
MFKNFSLVDTGGGFRDTTEVFWNELKTKVVNGGRIFDEGESVFFLQYNKETEEWKYPQIVGKALCWCWLHEGAWPRWLHQMHMVYIINGEEQINCVDVLGEYLPALYNLVLNLQSNIRDNKTNETLSIWAMSSNKDVCDF